MRWLNDLYHRTEVAKKFVPLRISSDEIIVQRTLSTANDFVLYLP